MFYFGFHEQRSHNALRFPGNGRDTVLRLDTNLSTLQHLSGDKKTPQGAAASTRCGALSSLPPRTCDTAQLNDFATQQAQRERSQPRLENTWVLPKLPRSPRPPFFPRISQPKKLAVLKASIKRAGAGAALGSGLGRAPLRSPGTARTDGRTDGRCPNKDSEAQAGRYLQQIPSLRDQTRSRLPFLRDTGGQPRTDRGTGSRSFPPGTSTAPPPPSPHPRARGYHRGHRTTGQIPHRAAQLFK